MPALARCTLLLAVLAALTCDVSAQRRVPWSPDAAEAFAGDWLVDAVDVPARVLERPEAAELVLHNGLVARTFRLAPDAATVGLDDLSSGAGLLRSVRPEGRLVLDGLALDVGGLVGQPNHAYLADGWLDDLEPSPLGFRYVDHEVGEPQAPFAWARVRHHAPDAAWPPPGVHLRMDYALPEASAVAAAQLRGADGEADRSITYGALRDVRVSVHYELYDGVPVFAKWLEVHNGGARPVSVDRFTAEILAVVEYGSQVEARDGVDLERPQSLHVETDMAFGGMRPHNANRHAVHWRPDPLYHTQVNYLRQQPCLLEVEPTYGPAQVVGPGETFESFRVFELVHDGSERERRGLALRRMYRTIAPWITENPLMMHVRHSDPETVRRAIDQCAEVGFEMLILSFGSGFDMENDDPAYLARWRETADYAASRGVEIGGYSLLSSRRIGDGNDVVSPPGQSPTHGSCPALTSAWGLEYMARLYAFFEATGFRLLEHDGPYPGDVDVTPRPPHQQGEQDSRWVQWRIVRDFYRWCRGQGIFLNTPDYYYLAGSNKCGMGYREVNWSLPRAQQVVHTRQNIYDGTWEKTPSMGWMFVPLTEYHGGGAAATIEPLDEHRDHYERMLAANLGLGVQACYRGPRLFDTERTRDLVAEQVAWFKAHRDILESDVVHGRRADGRDLDWMLHVNPRLEEQGLLVVYNPLDHDVQRTLDVDLYYTGLDNLTDVSGADGESVRLELDRRYRVALPVSVPAGGMSWYVFRDAGL